MASAIVKLAVKENFEYQVVKPDGEEFIEWDLFSTAYTVFLEFQIPDLTFPLSINGQRSTIQNRLNLISERATMGNISELVRWTNEILHTSSIKMTVHEVCLIMNKQKDLFHYNYDTRDISEIIKEILGY